MDKRSKSENTLLRQLHEREKELDALYRLASLFTDPQLSVESILRGTSDILRNSMQYPESVEVSISLSDGSGLAGASAALPAGEISYAATASYSIGKHVELLILCPDSENIRLEERECYLADSTASLLANVLQKKELEGVLKESTVALQQQKEKLENKNIALKEVLCQIETERQDNVSKINAFFDSVIFPEINKLSLSENLPSYENDIVSNISKSLENRFGRDTGSLIRFQQFLTPREFEICSLIKNGMSTKEMASHLSISETTIERHRNNIRKKLNLNNSSVNLVTFLRSPSR